MWRGFLELFKQLRTIDFLDAEAATKRVVMRQKSFDLCRQRIRIGKIKDVDCPAANLVFIGWADTAPRRADLGACIGRFTSAIQFAMNRKDQRGVFGNLQRVWCNDDALRFKFLFFRDESMRVENNTVSDDGQLTLTYHTGRQQRQFIGYAIDDQRMTCIVTALKADNDIGPFGKPIDNLSFAFVTPLGTNHNNIRHSKLLKPNLVAQFSVNAVLLYRLVHKSATILSDTGEPICLYLRNKPIVRTSAKSIAPQLEKSAAS